MLDRVLAEHRHEQREVAHAERGEGELTERLFAMPASRRQAVKKRMPLCVVSPRRVAAAGDGAARGRTSLGVGASAAPASLGIAPMRGDFCASPSTMAAGGAHRDERLAPSSPSTRRGVNLSKHAVRGARADLARAARGTSRRSAHVALMSTFAGEHATCDRWSDCWERVTCEHVAAALCARHTASAADAGLAAADLRAAKEDSQPNDARGRHRALRPSSRSRAHRAGGRRATRLRCASTLRS